MGEVDARFGLRLAAAGLPGGEGPGVLLVEVDSRPDGSLPQPMGCPPPDLRGRSVRETAGVLADRNQRAATPQDPHLLPDIERALLG